MYVVSFSGSKSRSLSALTSTSTSLPLLSTALTFSSGLNTLPASIVISSNSLPFLVIVGGSVILSKATFTVNFIASDFIVPFLTALSSNSYIPTVSSVNDSITLPSL